MRVVRTSEGEVLADPSGKMNGRGAYVCRDPKCISRMQKSGALARALRCAVPAEVYESCFEEIDHE